MLTLLNKSILFLFKLISFLLTILVCISSLNFIAKLIANPSSIKQLIEVLQRSLSLSLSYLITSLYSLYIL